MSSAAVDGLQSVVVAPLPWGVWVWVCNVRVWVPAIIPPPDGPDRAPAKAGAHGAIVARQVLRPFSAEWCLNIWRGALGVQCDSAAPVHL